VVPQHYVATASSTAPTAIQLPTAACSKRPLSRQSQTKAQLTVVESTALYELLKSEELSDVDSVKSNVARDTRNGLLDEHTACNVRSETHAQYVLLNQRKLAMCGIPSPSATR
jgi:hypothetical protein